MVNHLASPDTTEFQPGSLESSVNIFEDTTPEKWEAHFSSKIKNVLGRAKQDKEGRWIVSDESARYIYEHDAPQKMAKHYSEFMTANTNAKPENE